MTKIVLKVLGEEWTGKGKTITEALQSFNIDWVNIKGKGVMNITAGDKKLEKLYNMATLRRMFNNKIALIAQAKNLELLLK